MTRMHWFALASLASLAVACASSAPSTHNRIAASTNDASVAVETSTPTAKPAAHRKTRVQDRLAQSKLSLREAIGRALEARPGHAVEAELEGKTKNGEKTVYFEVAIVTAENDLFEVRLDAASGAVLANEKKDRPDDLKELVEFRKALALTTLSLSELIARAEAAAPGVAYKAQLEIDKGKSEVEVRILRGHESVEACMDGGSGNVNEIENENDDDDDAKGDEMNRGGDRDDDDGNGRDDDDDDDDDDGDGNR